MLSKLTGKLSKLLFLLLFITVFAIQLQAKTTAHYFANYSAGQADAANILQLADIKTTERNLSAGTIDKYQLHLASNQFIQVKVAQHDIDIYLAIYDSQNNLLVQVDTPDRKEGVEPLFWIADKPDNYIIEVRPIDNWVTGRYRIELVELREATARDNILIAAQQDFSEACQLRKQNSKESISTTLNRFELSRSKWQEAKQADREADTLNMIGRTYTYLSENSKAINYFEQAIKIYQNIGDQAGDAYATANIGVAKIFIGDVNVAISHLNRALEIFRALNSLSGQGLSNANLGYAYNALQNQAEALKYYQQALPLLQSTGNRRLVASVNSNLGRLFFGLGDYSTAADFYDKTLNESLILKDQQLECHNRYLLCLSYTVLANYQKALDNGFQSIELAQKINDRRAEAYAIIFMGSLYQHLGEYQTALDYYNRALIITRAIDVRGLQADILLSLADLYYILGDKKRALEYGNEGLSIARAIKDQGYELLALNSIGKILAFQGDIQKALESYNQALQIARTTKEQDREIIPLEEIAAMENRLGNQQQANLYFNEALQLTRKLKKPADEARVLYGIAGIKRQQGDLLAAYENISSALNLVESIRSTIASQQLRATYLATVQEYYEFSIDTLMQLHKQDAGKGYNAIAVEVYEKSKARSFLDLLAEVHANVYGEIRPELVEKLHELELQLAIKITEQKQLFKKDDKSSQLENLNIEIQNINEKLQQLELQIRKENPHYAELKYPSPISIAEIQQLLDDKTLLLEYQLGKERSYLWVISTNKISSFELPARKTVVEVAQTLYQLLTARVLSEEEEIQLKNKKRTKATIKAYQTRIAAAERDYNQAATALSRMILTPAAAQLTKRRLLIVSDGALQYIPFSALPELSTDEKTVKNLLIIDHEIINLPSASVLAILRHDQSRPERATKQLIIFADPVFSINDPRVKAELTAKQSPNRNNRNESEIGLAARAVGITEEFERLGYTRVEAESITSLLPSSECKQLLDFDANRSIALSDELKEYQIVHFATHGIINNSYPALSGLVLSLVDDHGQQREGFIRLQNTFSMKLNAELVVLSACKTALGKEIKGEGLVGLTRGFMYAGAKNVIASLWNVNDEATSELMRYLYQGMLGDKHLHPEAALREAQLKMLKTKRFSSPYYWAAFILQGDASH